MISSDQVREARTALGMTQPEFAQALGLTRDAVAKWEQGAGVPARRELAVAEVLGDALVYAREMDEHRLRGDDLWAYGEWLRVRAEGRAMAHYQHFADPEESALRPHQAALDPFARPQWDQIGSALSAEQVVAALRRATPTELADELVRRAHQHAG